MFSVTNSNEKRKTRAAYQCGVFLLERYSKKFRGRSAVRDRNTHYLIQGFGEKKDS